MPANLACAAVSRYDQPQPTCSKSVCSNDSIVAKPRNRFTAPLLRPACSQPSGSSSRTTGQSSSSDTRKRLHPNRHIINTYLSDYAPPPPLPPPGVFGARFLFSACWREGIPLSTIVFRNLDARFLKTRNLHGCMRSNRQPMQVSNTG